MTSMRPSHHSINMATVVTYSMTHLIGLETPWKIQVKNMIANCQAEEHHYLGFGRRRPMVGMQPILFKFSGKR